MGQRLDDEVLIEVSESPRALDVDEVTRLVRKRHALEKPSLIGYLLARFFPSISTDDVGQALTRLEETGKVRARMHHGRYEDKLRYSIPSRPRAFCK